MHKDQSQSRMCHESIATNGGNCKAKVHGNMASMGVDVACAKKECN